MSPLAHRHRAGLTARFRRRRAYTGFSPAGLRGFCSRASRCAGRLRRGCPPPAALSHLLRRNHRTDPTTGSTFACTGDSQVGSAPAKFSSRNAVIRSIVLMMPRWMTTGRCFCPSSPTYSSSNRSGSRKSSCAVDSVSSFQRGLDLHVQLRPVEGRLALRFVSTADPSPPPPPSACAATFPTSHHPGNISPYPSGRGKTGGSGNP